MSQRGYLFCPIVPALAPGLVRSGRVHPTIHNADSRKATKADVEAHFATHGTGEITEIKLMNGFGFIEYKDAMDARDVVPGKYTLHASYHQERNTC